MELKEVPLTHASSELRGGGKSHPISGSNIERISSSIERGEPISVSLDGAVHVFKTDTYSPEERKNIAHQLRELRKCDISEFAKNLGVSKVVAQSSLVEDIVRRCLLQRVSQEKNSATCAVASIELRLIQDRPSEYIRMVRELVSGGSTKTLSGETVKCFKGRIASDLDLTLGEIGIAGRVFQLSSMSHVYGKTGFTLSYDPSGEVEMGTRNKGFQLSKSLSAVEGVSHVRGLYDSQMISLAGTILGNHAGGQYVITDDGKLSQKIVDIISKQGKVNKVVSLNLNNGSVHTTHAVILSEIKAINGVEQAIFKDSFMRSSNGDLSQLAKLLPEGAHMLGDGTWSVPVSKLINHENPSQSMLRMIEVDGTGSLSAKVDFSASYAAKYEDSVGETVCIVNTLPGFLYHETVSEKRKTKKKYPESDDIVE